MSSYESSIAALEAEWSPENGFFWRIRNGEFRADEFQRALTSVSMIAVAEDVDLPRRLVSLLWYVPHFMQWQADRAREHGGDTRAYENAMAAMENQIARLLGVP